MITHAIGGGKADQVHRSYAPLNLAAIALHVDAPAALDAPHIQRGAVHAARALGAYPFNDSFTLGCHGPELGSRLELTTAQPLAHGAIDTPTRESGTVITGWAEINGTTPNRVLVTNVN
ncbi:hypothetical protein [Amycolatopsis sp. cmx-8-4]|uniref:hypothetical protein n=1 Tax=Amycolatopsis sp. cmx-8-4 TaxID=2790947 RepID=UPI003979DC6B